MTYHTCKLAQMFLINLGIFVVCGSLQFLNRVLFDYRGLTLLVLGVLICTRAPHTKHMRHYAL